MPAARGWFDWMFGRAPAAPLRTLDAPALTLRGYNAARRTRTNGDWEDSRGDADREIRWALGTVRSASRDAERNNGLFDRMLDMHVDNIVGRGFALQAMPRWPDGRIDQPASGIIEQSFRAWARGKVTADRQQNLNAFLKVACRSWVRDGEFFVRRRVIDGRLYLQAYEGDFVPETLDNPERAAGGDTRTVNGITIDNDGQRLAYHFVTEHPGANGTSRLRAQQTTSVPAAEVLHLYSAKRAPQLRGMPLGAASVDDLRMFKGYLRAELAAARLNAARPMSIEKTVDAQGMFTGDGTVGGKVEIDASESGVSLLDPGYTMKWAPVEHPSGALAAFELAVTRYFASSWGVSHALLTRNLSQVNYSSLRVESVECARYFGGKIDDFVERLLDPIYQWWLEVELLAGRLGAPSGRFVFSYANIDKYREVVFVATPFPSYDPQKDLAAERERVRMNIKSLSAVCLEQTGKELSDVIAERQAERELLQKAGLIDVQEQEQKTAAPVDPDEAEPPAPPAKKQEQKP